MTVDVLNYKYKGLVFSIDELSPMQLKVIYDALISEKARTFPLYKHITEQNKDNGPNLQIIEKYKALQDLIQVIEQEKILFI